MTILIRAIMPSTSEDTPAALKALQLFGARDNAGFTMYASDYYVLGQASLNYPILEDEAFNQSLVVLDTIVNKEDQNEILTDLKAAFGEQLPVMVIGGSKMEETHYALTIYFKEKEHLFKKERYEEILAYLKEQNALWSTAFKGLAGCGRDHVFHEPVLADSEHTPWVVQSIVLAENLTTIIAGLKDLLKADGELFYEPVMKA